MSKNLKVDSKTNILEFKRKHNGLVESSSIKEETTNIENLSDEIINSLKVGDVVVKKTGNQGHAYIVTYKEEKHGICLSYFAAGYLETVSYDYTNGNWVFNSKDVFNMVDIPSGTINKVLGIDSSGKIVKGNDKVGTTLYVHYIDLDASGNSSCNILSSRNIPFTSTDKVDYYTDDSIIKIMVNDDNQSLYTMAEFIDFATGKWQDLSDAAQYDIYDYEFQEDVIEAL